MLMTFEMPDDSSKSMVVATSLATAYTRSGLRPTAASNEADRVIIRFRLSGWTVRLGYRYLTFIGAKIARIPRHFG